MNAATRRRRSLAIFLLSSAVGRLLIFLTAGSLAQSHATGDEWSGFWKTTPQASWMTDEERDGAWDSLRGRLSGKYLGDWTTEWQRHCFVPGDFHAPERTLTIVIQIPEVLSIGFLSFVREWLRQKAPLWRSCIPTDNTDRNMILIYPEIICVNPEAESDLAAFVERIRPSLAALIEKELGEFGLIAKPRPPMPLL